MGLKSDWMLTASVIVFGIVWCLIGYTWGRRDAKDAHPDWVVTPKAIVADCAKLESEAESRGRDAMAYELLKHFTLVCQDYKTYLIPVTNSR